MAMPKVCGIETEYGIVVRGAENNPVTASSLLINAYVAATARARSAGTSRTSTRPTTPAGSPSTTSLAPEVETHLVNAVLTNGARYYVDHAHPEISHARVPTALEVVRLRPRRRGDRARRRWSTPAELLARRRRDRRPQEQLRRQGQQLRLPRELPARPRARRSAGSSSQITPHFVTRQIVHRRRQGRLRAARPCRPTTCRTS